MITVDFIGILLTSCLVGIRYPGYLILAIIAHEAGRVILALFFQGHIDSIVVSGVFSATSVTHLSSGVKASLVALGGPLANYVVSSTVGGVEWEKTSNLVNPFSTLRHPLSVINLRFGAVSFLISIARFF
ncbi:hypothetical protein AXX12_05110 [Anaerosporomusa subterranea]|uniref:Uncharacterized protein n=1 Tax=Anaerosporomusa subterranea TaxID=1794912 RepID=A0A154BVH6_ANASB|nr:hypothetical protein [Anaerosporomusa subterranea]KYZ77488.1 hypothetical protein AXX12_05110 [Anaerosporomusa subterranea]